MTFHHEFCVFIFSKNFRIGLSFILVFTLPQAKIYRHFFSVELIFEITEESLPVFRCFILSRIRFGFYEQYTLRR